MTGGMPYEQLYHLRVRLVDGYMRMNPEQSEAVHLIFDAYDGGNLSKK